MPVFSVQNISKPAPRWFRKTKKATMILVVAANTMIASWGLADQLFVTRLQLWCTIGIAALLEALESLLSNGEEYVKPEQPTVEASKPV